MTKRGLVVWFGALLALSLYSRWQAPALRQGRCSLDGNRILPAYRVDLISGGELCASFCCIRCALDWPEVPARAAWHVRDEISGRALDSSKACFVESSVVTVPARRDRTHAFARWADAMQHIGQHGGERVPDPFAPLNGHEPPKGHEEAQPGTNGERDEATDRDENG